MLSSHIHVGDGVSLPHTRLKPVAPSVGGCANREPTWMYSRRATNHALILFIGSQKLLHAVEGVNQAVGRSIESVWSILSFQCIQYFVAKLFAQFNAPLVK